VSNDQTSQSSGRQAGDDWTITARTPEEAETIALMKQAGVLPHEACRDRDGEILVNLTGARKLAACAPDRALAAEFVQFAEGIARNQKERSV